MCQKYEQGTYQVNVNVNLMVENSIQIKSGITINVDVSGKIQKKSTCAKNIYLESCYM